MNDPTAGLASPTAGDALWFCTRDRSNLNGSASPFGRQPLTGGEP
jgi:hypothetical protein